MKLQFAVALAALTLASAAMWIAQPRSSKPGTIPLVWTTDDNPLRKEQTALFNMARPDYDLQIDPVNQSIEKVIVQALAGVGPDLIDVRDPHQLSAYVRSGIAWDVTDELASRGIDVRGQTWQVMQGSAILDGRIYGVPTNCAVNALWVNRGLLKEQGIVLPRAPWKWEDLIPIAERLTIRDRRGKPQQFGLLFDWWNWPHFLYSYGGRMFNESGTRCTLDTPQAREAIQMMYDLIYKFKVAPNPVEEAGMASSGGWGSGTINLFGAKRGAIALGGRWWLANLRKFNGLSLDCIESPYGRVRAFSAAGRVTIVNRNSPRRRQAIDFLAYLASPEYNRLVNHQADGIAAFKAYCFGPEFEKDPKYPEETYNRVWRDATEFAVVGQPSPFVNGQLANRIADIQLDLVRVNAKSVAEALRDAAKQIDAAIQENLTRNPKLRQQWLETVERENLK